MNIHMWPYTQKVKAQVCTFFVFFRKTVFLQTSPVATRHHAQIYEIERFLVKKFVYYGSHCLVLGAGVYIQTPCSLKLPHLGCRKSLVLLPSWEEVACRMCPRLSSLNCLVETADNLMSELGWICKDLGWLFVFFLACFEHLTFQRAGR